MIRTLQQRLDAIRTAFEGKAPPDVRAVMHAATAALVESGAAERALGVGDIAPSFELPGVDGTPVRSAELLRRGPLVLSFFRGHW